MIEIIAIGNEILAGSIVDTNSQWLSELLRRKGFSVQRQTTLSDDPKLLSEGLKEAASRSSLIFTTGGLGPTFDDTTKQVVADLFERPLVKNKEVERELERKYENFALLQNQALLPEGTILLPNPLGTAPGFILSSSTTVLIVMPGIPQEMKRMMEVEVMPFLEKRFPQREHFFEEDLYFTLLAETDLDEILKEMQEANKGLTIGIYPSFGKIRVHLSVKEKEEERAKRVLFSCQEKLRSLFPHQLYSSTTSSIAKTVQELLLLQKKKIAVAESCTGGRIASMITEHSKSSEYFLGSLVTYSKEMKRDILKVGERTLSEKGEVSKETVHEMIDGLFHLTKADFALAISGIAGPLGATKALPVGTICLGVGKRGEKSDIGFIHLNGDRSMIIEWSAHLALSLLWRRAAFNLRYFPI